MGFPDDENNEIRNDPWRKPPVNVAMTTIMKKFSSQRNNGSTKNEETTAGVTTNLLQQNNSQPSLYNADVSETSNKTGCSTAVNKEQKFRERNCSDVTNNMNPDYQQCQWIKKENDESVNNASLLKTVPSISSIVPDQVNAGRYFAEILIPAASVERNLPSYTSTTSMFPVMQEDNPNHPKQFSKAVGSHLSQGKPHLLSQDSPSTVAATAGGLPYLSQNNISYSNLSFNPDVQLNQSQRYSTGNFKLAHTTGDRNMYFVPDRCSTPKEHNTYNTGLTNFGKTSPITYEKKYGAIPKITHGNTKQTANERLLNEHYQLNEKFKELKLVHSGPEHITEVTGRNYGFPSNAVPQDQGASSLIETSSGAKYYLNPTLSVTNVSKDVTPIKDEESDNYPYCEYCLNKNMDENVYRSHWYRDSDTLEIICPFYLQKKDETVADMFGSNRRQGVRPHKGGAADYKPQGNIKPCGFCKNNKENPDSYTTHSIRDPITNEISCPVLFAYKCNIFQATGSQAHTEAHCPYGKNNFKIYNVLNNSTTNARGEPNKPN